MFENEMLAKQQYDTAAGVASGIRNREIVPNLKAQRDELTRRIHKIDTLLALLENNPDFVKMLDLSRELI